MAPSPTALITGQVINLLSPGVANVRSNRYQRCTPGGIGHALAHELHERGLRVFATARSLDKIADLKDLGITCCELTVDDPESVASRYAHVSQELEYSGLGLNYLFNNAGLSKSLPSFSLLPFADPSDPNDKS